MNFQSRSQRHKGPFVEKPPRPAALICKCGNKYMATRADQKLCIRCIYHPEEASSH